ncbi:hypothetical protein ANO14919_038780 [Xylariales sp. No.14919]|nr:hypothetical protein ANO14919_038780 [Xylariales sp. No.14919]
MSSMTMRASQPGNGENAFTIEDFLVQANENGVPTRIRCQWRLSESAPPEGDLKHVCCLDLIITIVSTVPGSVEARDIKDGDSTTAASSVALEKIVRACQSVRSTVVDNQRAAKVILATRRGFLCRNDILSLRMVHCPYIEAIIDYSVQDVALSPLLSYNPTNLLPLLSSSPGALLLKHSSVSYLDTLEMLEMEVKTRLSFDWVLPTQPAASTIAVIGGRPLYDIKKGSYGFRGPFEAAQALGISLIVLDRPGHWLEGEKYSYLRQDFIAIDVSDDTALPIIIADALKGKKLDGIVTFSDEFVIATAKAAEALSLPTEPVQAILQAHYKDGTRNALHSSGIQTVRVESSEQLQEATTVDDLKGLQYPLIVKPCRGGASRGVRKARNHSDLQTAIQKMEKDGLSKHGVLIEQYIDGPEVDANFAVWNGEVLFCEISDDFPCPGDLSESTTDDDFAETYMVLPSSLPAKELEILKSSLHQSLLELGFSSGVFHVEARVKNSSMRYEETDGILDLINALNAAAEEPDAFLIEVNARPPGLTVVYSTLYTYGVDYCALQFLRVLGDRERFAALCKPFSSQTQYWCVNIHVPIHRENILVPHDFFDRVLGRLPEVAPHVARAEFYTQPGNVVSPIRGVGFFAYFTIHSRVSRRHLLEMTARVREVSRQVVDGE